MELSPLSQISVREYSKICKNKKIHILIDVRSDVQFEMISFEFYKLQEKNKNEKIGDDKKDKKTENIEINVCEENLQKIKDKKNDLEAAGKMECCAEMNDNLSDLKTCINRNVFVVHIPLVNLRNILSDEKRTEEFRNDLKIAISEKTKKQIHERRKTIESQTRIEERNFPHDNVEKNKSEIEKQNENENLKKNENVDESENENEIKDENENENENENEDTDEKNIITSNIYCLCRRGNDSILATQLLLKNGFENSFNIIGGLSAWADQIDKTFPEY